MGVGLLVIRGNLEKIWPSSNHDAEKKYNLLSYLEST